MCGHLDITKSCDDCPIKDTKNHKKPPFAIFEDRNSMVAKWRELGYTVFQPADGDF